MLNASPVLSPNCLLRWALIFGPFTKKQPEACLSHIVILTYLKTHSQEGAGQASTSWLASVKHMPYSSHQGVLLANPIVLGAI